MFKKVLFALTLVCLASMSALARGREYQINSLIGPTNSTSRVTIAAPASGLVNCLTDLTVVSNTNYTVRILNGGTTVYAIDNATSTVHQKTWPIDDPFCVAASTIAEITVSAGTYSINYKGFVGR